MGRAHQAVGGTGNGHAATESLRQDARLPEALNCRKLQEGQKQSEGTQCDGKDNGQSPKQLPRKMRPGAVDTWQFTESQGQDRPETSNEALRRKPGSLRA